MKLKFRQLLTAVLAVCLLLGCASSAMAASLPETEQAVLSDMGSDELAQFLRAQGIEVPDCYLNYITRMIPYFESDPSYPIGVSNPVLYVLAAQVRDTVSSYYGREVTEDPTLRAITGYTLQDSAALGEWRDAYHYYNCYAYAVNRTDAFYWPGKFSIVPNKGDFNSAVSIASLAHAVKLDLTSSSFNKCVFSVTTVRPTSLSSNQSCICIRNGPEDFHLMKMNGSSWYHKPAQSVPLKYKYAPSTSRIWSNELSWMGTIYEPTLWYDSDIYYLLYKSSHGSTAYQWTGQDYHAGLNHFYQYGYLCSDCGEYTNLVWTSVPCSGPPCAVPWSLTSVPEVS